MKLGELKAQIRNRKGNPSVAVELAGRTAQVTVQKASIMATLDEMFHKARNAETGLYLHDDGRIVSEPVNLDLEDTFEIDDLDDL